MREIKFRCFHNGCMHDDFVTGERTVNTAFRTAKIQVMQFTGLKDYNGVDIYEGDIISDSHFIWKVVFNDHTSTYKAVCVNFNNPIMNNAELHSILSKRLLAKMPCRVIGNIYENPELLKG